MVAVDDVALLEQLRKLESMYGIYSKQGGGTGVEDGKGQMSIGQLVEIAIA